MTFIDWFAGVGGFRRGMELAGHRCVGFCEFDKYAVASYTAMHLIDSEQRAKLLSMDMNKRAKEILKDEYRNGEWFASDVVLVHAGDIPRADVWCFGFPCQDISVAGKQKGFKGNRSSLFFRITGLLRDLKEEDRPHTLFIENVKNLLSINGGWDFARVLIELDEIGYDAEWDVLNSKDFGVPQNRERCFIIGHLRGRSGRKVFPLTRDAEQTGVQKPGTVEQIGMLDAKRFNPNQYRVYDKNGIAPCLNCMEGGGREPHIVEGFNSMPDGTARTIKNQYQKNSAANFSIQGSRGATRAIHVFGNVNPSGNGINGQVYHTDGLSPTISTNKEDGEPMFTLTAQDRHGVMVEDEHDLKIVNRGEECESKRIYDPSGIAPSVMSRDYKDAKKVIIPSEVNCINISDEHGKERPQQDRVYDTEGVMTALNAQLNGRHNIATNYRIRKLTPKECFRLQGWTDDYFEKAAEINSNSQLYKQAGNGVTVNVIYEIARRL